MLRSSSTSTRVATTRFRWTGSMLLWSAIRRAQWGRATGRLQIDERADEQQTEALGAIFSGAEGGPMAAFAPLIGNHLGVKKVAIKYAISGKSRSAEIPGIMQMAVEPLPTMHSSGEIWAAAGHPVAPDKFALAVGAKGSTFADHGMRWDNSGKNGHYAPISWSN